MDNIQTIQEALISLIFGDNLDATISTTANWITTKQKMVLRIAHSDDGLFSRFLQS